MKNEIKSFFNTHQIQNIPDATYYQYGLGLYSRIFPASGS